MMKLLWKARLLAFLLMAAMRSLSLAQSRAISAAPGCESNHRILAPKNPPVAADGSILAGQAIVQARLVLDENTTVRVVEYPRTGRDIYLWNTTIIVRRAHEAKRYPLRQLIKYGDTLRLVEVASLCASSDQGTIFFAFESFATGAAGGFAIIRYSPGSVDVKGFPPVAQGRIVINRSTPDKVELWSASGSPRDAIECDACKKFYRIEDCHVGQQSVKCTPRAGTVGPLSPEKFMRARIAVR